MTSNVDPSRDASRDEIEGAMLDALVAALVQSRSAIATLQAYEAHALSAAMALVEEQSARISGDSRRCDMPLRTVAAEIGAALRVNDRTIQRQMADAATLAERFPRTLAALAQGEISRAHVAVIVDCGFGIEDPSARAGYESAVLERSRVETAGRLRPMAKVLASMAQPRSIDERHREARAERSIKLVDLDDGMAEILATLPAVLAHGIHDRLTQQAISVTEARSGDGSSEEPRLFDVAEAGQGEEEPDRRSMDELRADIFCDMLLAAEPVSEAGHATGPGLGAIRSTVQVTVPVLTLLGRGEEAACLAGHGPIDAETARSLAGSAVGWDRVMTHPITGAVLAVDRYRPSAELRRSLQVRDAHCRFPGCRMPTSRCDIDHTHDAAFGGDTVGDNLAHLCRRHHTLKHASRWAVRQVGGGLLEWTSPTGRVYIDTPERKLCFVPSGRDDAYGHGTGDFEQGSGGDPPF
jgi:hypothetical protein